MNSSGRLVPLLFVYIFLIGCLILAGQRPIVRAQDVGSVQLLPSVGGNYRWRDVADNLYSATFRGTYSYSGAHVYASFYTIDTVLHGVLGAVDLKPNFAYQLKLTGIPDTASNERIGLVGRWWQEEWSGSAWVNGQNLNSQGDGSSPNPNDDTYFARRDIADPTSPTGRKYCYTGYLVFDCFITDSNGKASLVFKADSSYHVLWKTTQRARSSEDGPLKVVTFDPNPSEPAYDVDYLESSVSVFGEWERLPVGGVFLRDGVYDCKILLTEESFHGSGGEYSGSWAAALERDVSFTITAQPPRIMLLISGPTSTARGSTAIYEVLIVNPLSSLSATVYFEVVGPSGYAYFDYQPVIVDASGRGWFQFTWQVPTTISTGLYQLSVGLIPPRLSAYDSTYVTVL